MNHLNDTSPLPEAGILAHPKYRPDIDGLRAIAVLSVVGFHVFPYWVKGGFIGVDIFFVISGFLISTIIFGSLKRNQFHFLEFYTRRIHRIFPAFITVLVATFVFGWLLLLPSEYKQLGKHIAGGAGFVSNFILWGESGYFDNSAETKPLLHLWSLGIEEQFYIIYPLLLWLAWKLNLNLLTVIVAIALISFEYNIVKSIVDPVAGFYSPQTRFWELMVGSILAYTTLHEPKSLIKFKLKLEHLITRIIYEQPNQADKVILSNVQSFLGAVLLGSGILTITQDKPFPGWWALLPTLGVMLLISGGSEAWINRRLLSNRTLIWFGLISFPLYLWHWVILSFAHIIESQTPSREVRIIVVLTSVIFAWITYRFIERPIRFGFHRKTETLTLLLLMAIIGSFGYYTFVRDGLTFRAIQRNYDEVFLYENHWDGWEKCDIVSAPKNNYGEGGCRVLKMGKPIDVAVIGDSHAGHLASGLKEYFEKRKENVAEFFHAGCYPFFSVSIHGEEYYKCDGDLIEHSLKFSMTNESTKLIILSGYAARQIQIFRYHDTRTISESRLNRNLTAFDAGLNITLSTLTNSGKNIIYLIDNPELVADPKSCIKRNIPFIKQGCSINISIEKVTKRNKQYYKIIKKYKLKYPKVRFVSIADVLCDESTCYGYNDDGLLYSSRDHLSPNGSRKVIQGISNYIDEALH